MKKLLKVKDFEDDKAKEIFVMFKKVRKQGYLTKDQLINVLKWKSPRPLNFYLSNSEKDIKDITSLAFETSNDKLRIHILTALKGVSIPAASAVLMFYNPSKYAVIDIRVWQQLYNAKYVSTNSKGQGFSLEEWEVYLKVIRSIAKEFKLTARKVEKRLFDLDKVSRVGNLY